MNRNEGARCRRIFPDFSRVSNTVWLSPPDVLYRDQTPFGRIVVISQHRSTARNHITIAAAGDRGSRDLRCAGDPYDRRAPSNRAPLILIPEDLHKLERSQYRLKEHASLSETTWMRGCRWSGAIFQLMRSTPVLFSADISLSSLYIASRDSRFGRQRPKVKVSHALIGRTTERERAFAN